MDTLTGAPFVSIWRCDSCTETAKIWHAEGSRGVYACGFSGGQGRYLTTVCGDNNHTVRVLEWAIRKEVATGPGHTGVPQQVFGVVWDRYTGAGDAHFVTYGVKHLKLWARGDQPKQLFTAHLCAWSGAEPRDILCAAFLPAGLEEGLDRISVANRAPMRVRKRELSHGMLATGHANGEVYLWRQRMVVGILRTYESDPAAAPSLAGNPSSLIESHAGVRCLRCWQHVPKAAAAGKGLGSGDAGKSGEGRWFLATGVQHTGC